MGCLKLSYYQTYSNRKVLNSDCVLEPKNAQMWLSVDPMSDKYPTMSPYNYCANNPVILVDPDGRELEPIVGLDGELLGCTKEGWGGKPIVMDKNNYRPGMTKTEALEQGKGKANGISLDQYGKGIKISEKTWKTIVSKGGERIEPYLINNSDKSVFYKPEGIVKDEDKNPGYNFDGAYEVKANTDLYVQFDGISTSKFENSVYKVQTGGRVTVTKDGSVIGGVSRTMPFLGWVSGPFRTYLGIRNDTSWNNLFESAYRNYKKK